MKKNNKFQVGDRVELVEGYGGAERGAQAVVTANDNEFVYIEWDRKDTRSHGQMHGGYYESCFTLFDPKRQMADYIICVKEKGEYAPSTSPRVFVSEKQALTVAEKMANEHGGEFVVFKAIAKAELPKSAAVVTRL